jgi:lipoprotein Spr
MLKTLAILFLMICNFSSFANIFSVHHHNDSINAYSQTNYDRIDSVLITGLSGYGIDKDLITCYPLYEKILEWMGTPYRFGGNSKKGIDCSRLVMQLTNGIYYDTINGSAATLYEASYKLDREDLSEGDLVFFKINKSYVSHVGVYLQKDLFVHATRGKGVMVSSLNESYYKKYFFGGGRWLID